MQIKPLSQTQLGIIRIVKSAIKSTKETLPEQFDWNEAQNIISFHSIEGLAYFGLINMGIEVPGWLKTSFLRETAFLTKLWHAAEKVIEAFDEAGIECIPLKGISMKDRYPNKYMRHMSDVDILIHENEYRNKIVPIMKKLGWEECDETDHELHWSKNELTIELHKRIIPSYNADYYSEVGDGWEWLKKHSENEYNFIHFAKHYRDGGIGIMHLCDMFFCDSFEGCGLDAFFNNVRKTVGVWFDGQEDDDKTQLITETIFESGKYGTTESKMAAMDLRKVHNADGDLAKANRDKRKQIVFLSWEDWKKRNPVLIRWPILLPFLWLWRAVSFAFKKKGRRNFRWLLANADSHAEYEAKLAYVGLKY